METQKVTESQINFGVVPIGAIIPYWGRLEDLNERLWQLCDGEEIKYGKLKGELTPKLTNTFLRGTTDQAENGAFDGNDTHGHDAFGNIGGTFTGNGTGRTQRGTGDRYPWYEDADVHMQMRGDFCWTAEWNVGVAVSGTIATNNHKHPARTQVPWHMKILFIMRIG